jgi:hypothetical protein
MTAAPGFALFDTAIGRYAAEYHFNRSNSQDRTKQIPSSKRSLSSPDRALRHFGLCPLCQAKQLGNNRA